MATLKKRKAKDGSNFVNRRSGALLRGSELEVRSRRHPS